MVNKVGSGMTIPGGVGGGRLWLPILRVLNPLRIEC